MPEPAVEREADEDTALSEDVLHSSPAASRMIENIAVSRSPEAPQQQNVSTGVNGQFFLALAQSL